MTRADNQTTAEDTLMPNAKYPENMTSNGYGGYSAMPDPNEEDDEEYDEEELTITDDEDEELTDEEVEDEDDDI
ncbi:hypothetical protein ACFPMF_10870 [Larkinella bovis]|uniref:Adhesin n=1 Tax=Larkinella bovis TaxID=683041 RepID=A0ABW0ICD7_9BACT